MGRFCVVTSGTRYPSDSGNPNIWWCAPDTGENRGRLVRAIRSLHWLAKATHLIRAVRYVGLNPVGARLVSRPEEWKWSSVRAHLSGVDDALVTVRPVLD